MLLVVRATREDGRRSRRTRTAVPARAVLLVVGVLGPVVALLAAQGLRPDLEDRAGHAVVAVTCVLGAAWLLRVRDHAVPARRATTRLLGAAFALYGLGQLLNAVVVGTHPWAPGDLVAMAVTPLVLAAFANAPAPSQAALPVTRLLLDSLLVATCVALAAWELLVPAPSGSWWASTVTVLVLVAVAACCSVPVLAALRDRGRGPLVLALGVAAFVVADGIDVLPGLGVDLPEGVLAASALWQAAVVVPTLAAATAWASATGRRGVDARPEAQDDGGRTATATTLVACVLLVLAVLAGGAPGLDPVARVLGLVVIALFLGREVLLLEVLRDLVRTLTRQALVDPLTGLPNAQALAAAADRACRAVVVLDIAGLDAVNQVQGRRGGDELVRQVALLVRAAAPPDATCFRAGGDEFAVVLPPLPSPVATARVSDRALALAERLQRDAQEHARVGEHGTRLHVGVAVAADGVTSVAEVVEDATQALHSAQQQRAGRPVLHDEAQRCRALRALAVGRRLPRAVARGEVDVLLQPIVDLRTGRVVAAEALARWHDDQLGHVPPPEFVAAAERCGVIDDLGEHVLRAALRRADDAGVLAAGVRLSVNVSPLQLQQRRLLEVVRDVVATHAVAPGSLALEVTESVLLDEDGPALWHLHELVASGVDVVIDDFGAGHASLGYLRRVPASTLKLDRGLVTAAASDARARAVLLAGLELCRSLGLTSVVEGVETVEVAEEMARLGADLGQGWLWSRAVPAEELALLLSAERTLSRPAVP